MSATVAATLKKIVIAILTDKKALKIVGGIVLGIVIVIIMPVITVISIFDGGLDIDAEHFQQAIVNSLSDEEMGELQGIEDSMNAIEDAMVDAGYASRVKDAQILYVLGLNAFGDDEDFVSSLVGCFAAEQTDEKLISAINSTFGTDLDPEDFGNVMEGVRSVYIDISGYTDPATKNNLDLVEWAIQAERSGWGYVWGTYGRVMTESLFEAKLEQYPDNIGQYADFIRANWLGRRTADCIGLIKGYSWLNVETHEVEYTTNGMPDVSANGMYHAATEKGSISTIPEIPGLAVWLDGHIGIYIGDGWVIEAMGTKYGVVKTELAKRSFTHWLKIPYITYVNPPEEPTEPTEEATEEPTEETIAETEVTPQ